MKSSIKKTVQSGNHLLFRLAVLALGTVILAMVAGCETGSSDFTPMRPGPAGANSSPRPTIPTAVTHANVPNVSRPKPPPPPAYTLREGDILKITFPGSPTLNTVQQIRTDGKITLPLIGEVDAAGLTTAELQAKLMKLYAPQLSTKAISVEVQSSAFPVYVTGAVLHPGKISTDHPITALEAIMEAGGFDYTTADLKDVTVLRQEGNQTKHYTLNLKRVMDGKESKPFYLKPADIIYVPQRFNWF